MSVPSIYRELISFIQQIPSYNRSRPGPTLMATAATTIAWQSAWIDEASAILAKLEDENAKKLLENKLKEERKPR